MKYPDCSLRAQCVPLTDSMCDTLLLINVCTRDVMYTSHIKYKTTKMEQLKLLINFYKTQL